MTVQNAPRRSRARRIDQRFTEAAAKEAAAKVAYGNRQLLVTPSPETVVLMRASGGTEGTLVEGCTMVNCVSSASWRTSTAGTGLLTSSGKNRNGNALTLSATCSTCGSSGATHCTGSWLMPYCLRSAPTTATRNCSPITYTEVKR